MQEVEGLDEEEKERRIKVASRIDELLNVSDPCGAAINRENLGCGQII